MTAAGFPHSDTPGSQLGCQLPRAYRRLQRPSSALDAKASTMRPCQLANTNTQQKQQRHTLQKQTPTPLTPTNPQPGIWAHQCGRCSRPLSRNQTTRNQQPPPQAVPITGSDASDTQQCAQEPPPPTTSPVPHPAQTSTGSTRRRHQRCRSFVDGSTIRTPPMPPPHSRDARDACSLERR